VLRLPRTKKQRSDLRLDSAEAIRRGGSSGQPVLVPGQPDKSLLLKAVRHQDGAAKMPPKEKLDVRQIADLVHWIETGAHYAPPAAGKSESGSTHWAFKAVANPRLPPVRDVAWPRSPLDRFILSRLETAGLKPAPEADKGTLIRRVTFDLTGLPPTPEEVKAFVTDAHAGAYEAGTIQVNEPAKVAARDIDGDGGERGQTDCRPAAAARQSPRARQAGASPLPRGAGWTQSAVNTGRS
jgi:hypothetical protein